MVEVCGVIGVESDDALGYKVFDNRGAICASIDKDLLMVPGTHYNIVSGKIIEASDPGTLTLEVRKYGKKLVGTGFKWFCAQMLMGDPVDNIVGLKRYGDVKAFKVLDQVSTPKAMWETVLAHYEVSGESTDRVFENASLLWIQRNQGELFPEWLKKNVVKQ